MPLALRYVLFVCFVAAIALIVTVVRSGCTAERHMVWRTVQPQRARLDEAIRRAISDDGERQCLLEAIDRSLAWLGRDDAPAFFPDQS